MTKVLSESRGVNESEWTGHCQQEGDGRGIDAQGLNVAHHPHALLM